MHQLCENESERDQLRFMHPKCRAAIEDDFRNRSVEELGLRTSWAEAAPLI
jgi:hypothetical protein